MKSTGRNKIAGRHIGRIFLAAVVLLIGVSVWQIVRIRHQVRLNAALIAVVEKGDVQEAGVLLAEGADPNAREKEESVTSLRQYLTLLFRHWKGVREHPQAWHPSALILATRRFDVNMARLLLKHGAFVDSRDEEGHTPLTAALGHVFRRYDMGGDEPPDPPYVPYVALLIDQGANLYERGDYGRTPLDFAAHFGDKDLVRLLIRKGVNVKGSAGGTAVREGATAFSDAPGVLKILIANGADVNAQDEYGQTALMEATFDDRPDVVKVLLAGGADVHIQNRDGRAVLELARLQGKTSIVRLLKRAGG